MVDDNSGKDVAGKGHATPSRRDAESARKKQMKNAPTRKEQGQRERAARQKQRLQTQEAMRTGDDKHLPARERGPVRRFLRDYVDRRYNVAEFMLPILLLILVLSLINQPWALQLVGLMWVATLAGVAVDWFLLMRGIKREMATRDFDPAETRGARFYALLRSTQLRRFRLPKPQIKRREALKASYR